MKDFKKDASFQTVEGACVYSDGMVFDDMVVDVDMITSGAAYAPTSCRQDCINDNSCTGYMVDSDSHCFHMFRELTGTQRSITTHNVAEGIGKKCNDTYEIEAASTIDVEECAVRVGLEQAAGNCGGKHFNLIDLQDGGNYKCECCTADFTADYETMTTEDEFSNIYHAGGDNLLFSETCNIKKNISGSHALIFTTSSGNDYMCSTENYEWQNVDRDMSEYATTLGQYISGITQTEFEINGAGQGTYQINAAPTMSYII